MWYVYILWSLKDGGYYIGSTNNTSRRLHEHNCGHNISTRNRRLIKLIYLESFPSRLEAIRRERQLKSFKGGEAFKKLIANNIRAGGRAVNKI